MVRVSLLAPRDDSPAWRSDFSAQILGNKSIITNSDGTWSLNLIPNSTITPSDSIYRVTQHLPGDELEVCYIVVPNDEGPHYLGELLTDAPSE